MLLLWRVVDLNHLRSNFFLLNRDFILKHNICVLEINFHHGSNDRRLIILFIVYLMLKHNGSDWLMHNRSDWPNLSDWQSRSDMLTRSDWPYVLLILDVLLILLLQRGNISIT